MTSVPTPELVPLIEAGEYQRATAEVVQVVNRHSDCDGIILGCTHYSVLAPALRSVVGEVKVFSQTEIIPERTEWYLEHHPEIKTLLSLSGGCEIETSGEAER